MTDDAERFQENQEEDFPPEREEGSTDFPEEEEDNAEDVL